MATPPTVHPAALKKALDSFFESLRASYPGLALDFPPGHLAIFREAATNAANAWLILNPPALSPQTISLNLLRSTLQNIVHSPHPDDSAFARALAAKSLKDLSVTDMLGALRTMLTFSDSPVDINTFLAIQDALGHYRRAFPPAADRTAAVQAWHDQIADAMAAHVDSPITHRLEPLSSPSGLPTTIYPLTTSPVDEYVQAALATKRAASKPILQDQAVAGLQSALDAIVKSPSPTDSIAARHQANYALTDGSPSAMVRALQEFLTGGTEDAAISQESVVTALDALSHYKRAFPSTIATSNLKRDSRLKTITEKLTPVPSPESAEEVETVPDSSPLL